MQISTSISDPGLCYAMSGAPTCVPSQITMNGSMLAHLHDILVHPPNFFFQLRMAKKQQKVLLHYVDICNNIETIVG